jgi:hypothetical protein
MSHSALRSIRSNRFKEGDTTQNIERRLVTRTIFLRHAFAYSIRLCPDLHISRLRYILDLRP